MFKRILAALLTVIFTVMLFGCNRVTEDNASDMSRAEELSSDESNENSESDVSGEDSGSSSDVSYEYDSDGRVTKKIIYAAYNQVDSYIEYEYDGDGRCCKETCFFYDGMLHYTDIREFDDDGKETVTLRYFVGEKDAAARYECCYDENGKLSKKLWIYPEQKEYNEELYDVDGNMTATIYSHDGIIPASRNEYDKNGNVIKYVNYNNEGKVTSTTEYTHNEKSQITGFRAYNGDGKLAHAMKREYNDKGKETRYCSEIFGEDGEINIVIVTEWEYNGDGNETKFSYTERVHDEITLERSVEYFYNDDGKLIKEVGNKLGEEPHETVYEYDEQGRLIKETTDYVARNDRVYAVIVYHDGGKRVEKTYYDSNGVAIRGDEQNELGRAIATAEYHPNGKLKKYTKFPTVGEIETIQYDTEGNIISHSLIVKNSVGKDTKRIIYDPDGNVTEREEHEYDIYGRLIKTVIGPTGDSSEVTVYEYSQESNI